MEPRRWQLAPLVLLIGLLAGDAPLWAASPMEDLIKNIERIVEEGQRELERQQQHQQQPGNQQPGSQQPQTGTPPSSPPATPLAASCRLVADIQHGLNERGFYRGQLDGLYGSNTKNAIQAYQRQRGLQVDGRATPQLRDSLVATGNGELRVTVPNHRDGQGTFWDNVVDNLLALGRNLRPDVEVCVGPPQGRMTCGPICENSLECAGPAGLARGRPYAFEIYDVDKTGKQLIWKGQVSDLARCAPCRQTLAGGPLEISYSGGGPRQGPAPENAGEQNWSVPPSCQDVTRSASGDARAVISALDVIARHGGYGKPQLRSFQRQGARVLVCSTGATAWYDEFNWIVIRDSDARTSRERLVRILSEEVAHAARPQEGWPDPAALTQRDFVGQQADQLLWIESLGQVQAIVDSDLIGHAAGMNVPIVPLSSAQSRRDYERAFAPIRARMQAGASDRQAGREFVPFIADKLYARSDGARVWTYRQHFQAEAEKVYGCYCDSRAIRVRERWMCAP